VTLCIAVESWNDTVICTINKKYVTSNPSSCKTITPVSVSLQALHLYEGRSKSSATRL